METISLKTVYQTLYDLAELGEIVSLDVGTGMTRFDPNTDDLHHHLVCRRCGSVRDLVADFPQLCSPEGAELGFEVGSAPSGMHSWGKSATRSRTLPQRRQT